MLLYADGWAVCQADSEVTTADGGVMIADTFELTDGRPDASYIALMHPPVALALAELLEFFADNWIDAKAVVHYSARADAQERATRTAREILREPS